MGETETTSTTSETIAYTYNDDDELLTETGSGTASAGNYEIIYAYDASGNLAYKANDTANTDIYSYDLRNLMIQDTTYLCAGPFFVPTRTYSFAAQVYANHLI
jgi:hypothetical protein